MAQERGKGRPRTFDTPELMWEAFLEYVKYEKSNPLLVQDYVGKDGTEVFREKESPLTMEGFRCWLWEESDYKAKNLERYFNGYHQDFADVSIRIMDKVRQDQIRGGMAGIYNPSITARLNGLVDKTENKVVQEQPLFSRPKKLEGPQTLAIEEGNN